VQTIFFLHFPVRVRRIGVIVVSFRMSDMSTGSFTYGLGLAEAFLSLSQLESKVVFYIFCGIGMEVAL